MNSFPNLKKPATENGHENESEQKTGDGDNFIGKEGLLEYFYHTLKQFREWNEKEDWLAFHHHHYDWWMFPINEISSRGREFQLTPEVIDELRRNESFIRNLREGVQLMVKSWGWDIDKGEYLSHCSDKQKWSHWPVRLYKAGRSMWLFDQKDYYQSLRKLAERIRASGEKLDYYSHTEQGKANVLEQWEKMSK